MKWPFILRSRIKQTINKAIEREKDKGELTTMDSMQIYGILQLQYIIHNLRKEGYRIVAIPKRSRSKKFFVSYKLDRSIIDKEPNKGYN